MHPEKRPFAKACRTISDSLAGLKQNGFVLRNINVNVKGSLPLRGVEE